MASYKVEILKQTEIEALLMLQRENLLQNIDPEVAASQGFLSFQYSSNFILQMMHDLPQPVAKAGDELIAYALATSCKAGNEDALLKPLVDLCGGLEFNNRPLSEQRFYLLGQICVKESWRGLGVFDAMYQKHRELFADTFDCVVTEISVANKRSQAAHERVGFKTIHQYVQNNIHWNVVGWDWKRLKD